MILLLQLLSPPVIGLLAVFFAIVWMLRNEHDKTRPLLVFALILNLFYGWLLSFVLGREESLLPAKFDYYLAALDRGLGLSAAAIAPILQGAWRMPLTVVYDLMLPMMIVWFFIVRSQESRKALVLSYIAEMVTGPLLYAILPACGPRYAFGAQWLHPSVVGVQTIRLGGMPNAFPSLHVGTAFLLLLSARGTYSRIVAACFVIATAAATIATGEHYLVDLIPGLVFGAFAACAGRRLWRLALSLCGIVLAWSLTVRFATAWMILHPAVLRSTMILTAAFAIGVLFYLWRTPVTRMTARRVAPVRAST